jgi:hypothetical protein
MSNRIALNDAELEAIRPAMARLQSLQAEAQIIQQTMQPFIIAMAKQRGLDPDKYQFIDGAFVERQEQPAGPQPQAPTPAPAPAVMPKRKQNK